MAADLLVNVTPLGVAGGPDAGTLAFAPNGSSAPTGCFTWWPAAPKLR
ncbi:hypothetical protein [Deinococcus sp.]|nr:hypothetical protein [Deinococcus sp.]